MKKLLSAILTLTLALSLSATAFAAESGNTNVTYDVAPAYTVTIPETATIGETATVSAQDVVINKGEHIEVALTDSDFKVKTDKGAELAYTVSMDGEQLQLGDAVLSVEPGDNNSGSSTLSFALGSGETVKYAGKYKGSVTFTISVKEGGAETAFYERIRTADQLRSFRDRVNSGETSLNAILMNDIDLGCDEENQWEPIRDFEGIFEGNGNRISGVYINRGENYRALFGTVKAGATVKNLCVDGSITGQAFVGGIVGVNEGKIENCFNIATVIGGADQVGGIAGNNSGSITNCYNKGSVRGIRILGGIVGYNPSSGTVTNCYNIGKVDGSEMESIGGIIGYNDWGSFENCYYLDTCGAGGSGTSLNAEQFKDQSNFAGFDFATVWQMNNTLGRPTLRSIPE